MHSSSAAVIDDTTPEHACRAQATPFVKWAGGKRSLVPALLQRLPNDIGTYHEPFLGGGALFFAIANRLTRTCLSDANEELIRAYQTIKTDCEAVIERLERHRKQHETLGVEHYNTVRKAHDITCPIECTARFIYLNRTCFNGLYRVNRAGEFNVPMGKYRSPAIVNAKNLRAVSRVLNSLDQVTLDSHDFADIKPEPGDLIYCDPPYDTTYDQYTRVLFNGNGQQRLAECANQWADFGVSVILSSSDTPLIRDLYRDPRWQIETVQAPNNINCKADGRGKRQELIITNA